MLSYLLHSLTVASWFTNVNQTAETNAMRVGKAWKSIRLSGFVRKWAIPRNSHVLLNIIKCSDPTVTVQQTQCDVDWIHHFKTHPNIVIVLLTTHIYIDRYIIIYVYTYSTQFPLCPDIIIIEGSLEVKLPTIWTDEKQSRAEAERRERLEERRVEEKESEERRCRCAKRIEKVGKSRNTVFFQWFGAPEARKVGSLKRRVRRQLARWEMKNCTPLWREAHFEVKMYKTHQRRTTFGSWDVEKVHAVVARSTFWSQNVQNTPASDHFWKLRCRKSARRCGAKHISKSKCTKHLSFGPLLEVEMSKKCTPLWREAHFQVKSVKNWRSRTTFGSWDVEKVSKKCTPLWREAHFEVKSVKDWGFWAFFWREDVEKVDTD